MKRKPSRRHQKKQTHLVTYLTLGIVVAVIMLYALQTNLLSHSLTYLTTSHHSHDENLLTSATVSTTIPVEFHQSPKSFSLTGRVLGEGTVHIWLASNGTQELVYTNAIQELSTITNRVVDESILEPTIQEPDAAGVGSEETPVVVEEQPPSSISITPVLRYTPATQWDVHDNGIERESEPIDVDLTQTTFDASVNPAHLCTRWTIKNSLDTEQQLCAGDSSCCAFLGLDTTAGQTWNQLTMYSGLYGADERTTLFAEIIYYHVNLDLENLTTDVAYSSTVSLPLRWVPETFVKTLDHTCQDSCTLHGIGTSAELIIEIEGDATVELTNYGYLVETSLPPVFTGNSTVNILMNGSVSINLSHWFEDPEEEPMQYSAEGSVNLGAEITDEILTIVPDTDFVGERDVTITADDGTEQTTVTVTVTVIKPETNETVALIVKDKQGKELGRGREISAARKQSRGRFGVAAQDPVDSIVVEGLRGHGDITGFLDTITPSNTVEEKLQTAVVGFPTFAFDSATISLARTGPVTAILTCPLFNVTTGTCLDWARSSIPFVLNDTHVTFTVTHFSGYAGANIAIINVQSYPVVGGNWTVWFNTTGTANLTITAIDGTTFTENPDDPMTTNDLEFVELNCDGDPVASTWIDGSIVVEDYACDGLTSSEVSNVLTPGAHHLQFTFGEDVGFANNDASSAPGISFTDPTLPNNTFATQEFLAINVSILNATDLSQFIWNWNGTNYSMYNDSLI